MRGGRGRGGLGAAEVQARRPRVAAQPRTSPPNRNSGATVRRLAGRSGHGGRAQSNPLFAGVSQATAMPAQPAPGTPRAHKARLDPINALRRGAPPRRGTPPYAFSRRQLQRARVRQSSPEPAQGRRLRRSENKQVFGKPLPQQVIRFCTPLWRRYATLRRFANPLPIAPFEPTQPRVIPPAAGYAPGRPFKTVPPTAGGRGGAATLGVVRGTCATPRARTRVPRFTNPGASYYPGGAGGHGQPRATLGNQRARPFPCIDSL